MVWLLFEYHVQACVKWDLGVTRAVLPPAKKRVAPGGYHGFTYFFDKNGSDGSTWNFPPRGTGDTSENVTRGFAIAFALFGDGRVVGNRATGNGELEDCVEVVLVNR
jgi:hypothetical protein